MFTFLLIIFLTKTNQDKIVIDRAYIEIQYYIKMKYALIMESQKSILMEL